MEYYRGHRVEGKWVFSGIEHESHAHNPGVYTIPSRQTI